MYTKESIAELADQVRSFLASRDERFRVPPYLGSGGQETGHAIQLLGGILKYQQEGEWPSDWGDGVIAPISAEREPAFEIRIPRHTSPKRNLFTIAHELGHLFVHMDYGLESYAETIAEGDFRDTMMARSARNATEYEANHFAACLLMPETEFRRVWGERAGDRDAVAEHFGVSIAAATTRGQFLELISWI
ncbi:ImmA/IrrE family metallo-endopeptidase [Endothiovibrio diazotrophicus]